MNMTASNVVHAGDLFARRYFPVESMVSHATHGIGYIRERAGEKRLVAFQKVVNQPLTQLSREEWPAEKPLNVRFVKTMEVDSIWIPASNLKLLALPDLCAGFSPEYQTVLGPFDLPDNDGASDAESLPSWLPV